MLLHKSMHCNMLVQHIYIQSIVHRSREERLLIQNLNLAGVALTLKCLRDVKSELSFFVCSPNNKCRVYSMRDWHSGFGHKGLWLKRRTEFMTTIMGYTKHYETMEFMIALQWCLLCLTWSLQRACNMSLTDAAGWGISKKVSDGCCTVGSKDCDLVSWMNPDRGGLSLFATCWK